MLLSSVDDKWIQSGSELEEHVVQIEIDFIGNGRLIKSKFHSV